MGLVRTINNGFTEYNAVIGFVHLSDIPTLRTDFPRGSYVIAIEDESRWVLDDNLVWCKLGNGKSSGLAYIVVDELPDPTTARSDVMYLYKEDGDDYYSIYFLSNGSLEKVGSTSTDFENIATKEDLESYIPNEGNETDGGLNILRQGDIFIQTDGGDVFIGSADDGIIEFGGDQLLFVDDDNVCRLSLSEQGAIITSKAGQAKLAGTTAVLGYTHEGSHTSTSGWNFDGVKVTEKDVIINGGGKNAGGKAYYQTGEEHTPTADEEIITVGSLNSKLTETLGDYLPIAGGTMEGDIEMQDNVVKNTNYAFNITNGLESLVDGTTTHYGATGFQIQTSADTQIGAGGIYINPVSLLYNFTTHSNTTMQWSMSSGNFEILGTNCFTLSISNDEFKYRNHTSTTEISVGSVAATFKLNSNYYLSFNSNQEVVNLRGGNRSVNITDQGVIIGYNGKQINVSDTGAVLTTKTTFTSDNEFVTKKFVDNSVSAAGFKKVTYAGQAAYDNSTGTYAEVATRVTLPNSATTILAIVADSKVAGDKIVSIMPGSVLSGITACVDDSGTVAYKDDLCDTSVYSSARTTIDMYAELNEDGVNYTIICV